MTLGLGLTCPCPPRPGVAPSPDALRQQIAQGGGSDVARDRLVRGDGRARALAVTGARLSSQRLAARAAMPAAAKRA